MRICKRRWYLGHCEVTNRHKCHSRYGEPKCDIFYLSHHYFYVSVFWWIRCEVTVTVTLWRVIRCHTMKSPDDYHVAVICRLHCEMTMTITLSWWWTSHQLTSHTMKLPDDLSQSDGNCDFIVEFPYDSHMQGLVTAWVNWDVAMFSPSHKI